MVLVTKAELEKHCKLGQGEECCAYLVSGPDGFQCGKLDENIKNIISKRLKEGTMNAKGKGCF